MKFKLTPLAIDLIWSMREGEETNKGGSKVSCSGYQERRLAIYWDREDHGNLEGEGSEGHFGHVYFEMLS